MRLPLGQQGAAQRSGETCPADLLLTALWAELPLGCWQGAQG